MSGKGKNAIDMTGGSLWKNILVFSLPLMMTQMLEVLFNLSDVAIAGKYADYIALGAVGSTALLVSLFTGILIERLISWERKRLRAAVRLWQGQCIRGLSFALLSELSSALCAIFLPAPCLRL